MLCFLDNVNSSQNLLVTSSIAYHMPTMHKRIASLADIDLLRVMRMRMLWLIRCRPEAVLTAVTRLACIFRLITVAPSMPIALAAIAPAQIIFPVCIPAVTIGRPWIASAITQLPRTVPGILLGLRPLLHVVLLTISRKISPVRRTIVAIVGMVVPRNWRVRMQGRGRERESPSRRRELGLGLWSGG